MDKTGFAKIGIDIQKRQVKSFPTLDIIAS